MSTLPLLVVEHETHCPPGWMGEWLGNAGLELDVRRPYAGEVLPDHLEDHSGLIVLGGSQGANDDSEWPWLVEVRALLRDAAAEGTPALGLCLGHQLLAVALGGRVRPNPHGQQVGVLEVGWTAAAYDDPLLGPLARRGDGVPAAQWNDDVVTGLPDGAVVLAQTPREEIQAVRFAPHAWGVQWHPEAGAEIIGVWAEQDRDRATEAGVDVQARLAEIATAREDLRATWRVLAERFAELCHGRRARPAGRTGSGPGDARVTAG